MNNTELAKFAKILLLDNSCDNCAFNFLGTCAFRAKMVDNVFIHDELPKNYICPYWKEKNS